MHHLGCTVGIYGSFACSVRAARSEAGHELCWWETGVTCERRYRVGEQWYNFWPDAQAEYRIGQQPIRFWLEWDCGTMNARDLAIKFASYGHYLAGVGKRELTDPSVCLCGTRYRTGEAYVACSSS